MDFDHGHGPVHRIGELVTTVIGAGVSFLLFAGVVLVAVLLVRYLLVATRAAELYVTLNKPSEDAAPPRQSPPGPPAGPPPSDGPAPAGAAPTGSAPAEPGPAGSAPATAAPASSGPAATAASPSPTILDRGPASMDLTKPLPGTTPPATPSRPATAETEVIPGSGAASTATPERKPATKAPRATSAKAPAKPAKSPATPRTPKTPPPA